MEEEIGTWDSVLLENLTEDCFINNINHRYKKDHIYTYIGTSVVAVNPYRHISENTLEVIRAYGFKGIFQLPPHIYGLANLAYQSLKDQNEDQCIILSGESGSGKTESFKMIVNFLTHIQEKYSVPTLKKQSSSINSDAVPRTHRRASSSCSANFVSYNNGTSSAISRRQSPSPCTTTRKCDPSSVLPMSLRAESSERHSRKSTREKVVDFDFSRHKSTENISVVDTNCAYINAEKPPTKSCFKHLPYYNVTATKSPLSPGKNFATCTTHIGEGPIHKNVNGCRLCGHSRCNRAQSFEHDESAMLKYAKLSQKYNHQRGSCSNLTRQHSTECQADSHSLSGSTRRISLYEAHKMDQTFGVHSMSSRSKCNSLIQKLRECVTCADVFLEAMGNAATLQNNNSSRYGKLFDIEIDFKGDPMGVHITHYMLEKTRITNTNFGERNFHIFYQLLSGAEMQLLKSLKLYRNVEKYELLKHTSAIEEDRINFHYTKKSLEVLGLSADEINSIFRVIAVVLKLGNFIFVPVTNIDGTEGCQVSNSYEVDETSQLLHLEAQILLNCLTRVNSSCCSQDDVGSELDARQAFSVRNILCRTLYSRLFTWLVNKINDSLKSTKREKNLALLDFYGFEILENNSFEQFTINYSSEKIHQEQQQEIAKCIGCAGSLYGFDFSYAFCNFLLLFLQFRTESSQNFVHNVLKLEQELYVREGLEWTRIDFFDNESICELIDKPSYGILSLINETHLNTDEALLLRIQQCCAGHPNFLTSGPNSMCFKIRHFANVVNYSIHRFLGKNSDVLPKYISTALYQSKLSLVQSLFPEGNPRRQANKKPTTLSSNVRTQLQTLLSIVKNRRSHYAFCIKPNDCKQPRAFDLALVQHQVRYMSLMPLLNLCRSGHCFHLSHVKFFNRYKALNTITWPHFHSGSTIEGIALIIRNLPLPSAEFTIGTKNVFIRSPRTVYELEQFRKARLNDLAVSIQKTFRMYIKRKTFLRMRDSQIIISSAWRTWRAREEYRTMRYKKQVEWAVTVIYQYYRTWKIRQYLLTIPLRLPPNSLSPLSTEWPNAPKFLAETSRLLRAIYHRWKCYIYRNSFDQTSRNRMREKVTASIIFKDRKASYARSVGHPFVGDYVRLRHNQQWKKVCAETNDQYVVFADMINKITRSSGKFVPILLVLSTSSLLLLDQRTLQIKYRVPASEIYRMSLSPYMDDIAVFHVKASDFGRKKGDFIFQTGHVIEIVTKMFLVIQNATGKPPEVHISTEFDANFGQQTVIFSFKYSGASELSQGQPKVLRKANKMEVIV